MHAFMCKLLTHPFLTEPNLENAKAAFMKKYGPGSEIFEAARIREETGDKTFPIKGPYVNHPVKDFVKAVMAGASCTGGPRCQCVPSGCAGGNWHGRQ